MTTQLIAYEKPYLTGEQLCDKLISQGLVVPDKTTAAKIIERLSYYRFKAYLFPFQNTDKRFEQGTTFDDCYQLYNFDCELRNYLFNIIQHVEIGLRSSLDHWMVAKTDNRFWYLDSSLFVDSGQQIKTVSRIRDTFVDSKEPFALHFRTKYFNEYCPFYRELPPSWVAIELMTFGNLLKLIESFTQETVSAFELDKYAKKKCDTSNFQALRSWVGSVHELRNLCGHHSRLFNRNLRSPSGIRRRLKNDIELIRAEASHEPQLNRLYTAIAALQIIYLKLGYTERIGPNVKNMFARYPVSSRFRVSMGFPERWEDETVLFGSAF